MKNTTKDITKKLILALAIFLIGMALLSKYSFKTEKIKDVDISTVISQINADQVKSVEIKDDQLSVVLKDNTKEVASKEIGESFSTLLSNYQVAPEKMQKITVVIKKDSGWSYWFNNLLPFLILIRYHGTTQ